MRANLRAVGTDRARPMSGTLVGTAEVEGSPVLLTAHYDEHSNLRLFTLAPYDDGRPHASEYIETIPVGITLSAVETIG